MFRLTATTLRATTIAIPILLATAIALPMLATSIAAPANAQQISVDIGFDNFHNQLAPYGTWSNHSRWGEVWRPRADRGFRPYYNGYWANTREYGWLWVSNDSWGDVPYHYGRWVFDPRDGWLWVPGYVWGPSWVVWREGGGNIGWFPMPPDDYYGNGPYGGNFNNQYGYRDWYGPSFGNDQFLSLWIFVGMDRFGDRDYRNYVRPPSDYGRIFVQTNDTTNYITINNYVVNRSVDENRLPRERRQRFQPVPASSVIARDALVTQADVGRQVEQRERQRRPIPASIDRSDQRERDNSNSNAQENSNKRQRGLGGRDDDRGTGANGRTQANPQNDRGTAKSNAQQNTDKAPQELGDRGRDRGANSNGRAQSNPRAERDAPVINAPTPDSGARQGLAERRNRDATVPTAKAIPTEKRGQAEPQTERGTTRSFQSPQTRGAPEPSAKVIVQESRPAPRVQENPPAANRQGDTRSNQARANGKGDTKDADDQEKVDDRKTRADRGRN